MLFNDYEDPYDISNKYNNKLYDSERDEKPIDDVEYLGFPIYGNNGMNGPVIGFEVAFAFITKFFTQRIDVLLVQRHGLEVSGFASVFVVPILEITMVNEGRDKHR